MMNERIAKATFNHIAVLAKFYGVTNTFMLNAVLMGNYREELMEVIDGNYTK